MEVPGPFGKNLPALMLTTDIFQIGCQSFESIGHQLDFSAPAVIGPDKLQQAEATALLREEGNKALHPLPDSGGRTDDAVSGFDLEIDIGLLIDIADQVKDLILAEAGAEK